MHIIHCSSSHKRSSSRIFYRLCISCAKYNLKTSLIICDGLGNDCINGIQIYSLINSKNIFVKILILPFLIFIKSLKTQADIYHLHDPELVPIGFLLKLFGKKVIFDMHENIHLQILSKDSIKPKIFRQFLSKISRFVENIFLLFFDGVTVPQPIMVGMYKNQNQNIISICNYYMGDKINYEKNKFIEKDYKSLIYAGSISIPRGFENMINFMREMPDDYILNIAGNIPKSLLDKIPKSINKKIIVHGFLNQKELIKLYKKCGIGLIMFNNVGQYYMSYSLKLFEYMHYGLFIILPNFGEWQKFNTLYKVGVNLNVSDPKECAHYIKNNIRKNFLSTSKNNIKTEAKKFNWNIEEKKLINFYKKIYSS